MWPTLKYEFFAILLKRLTYTAETFEHENPKKRRKANCLFHSTEKKRTDAALGRRSFNPGQIGRDRRRAGILCCIRAED